MLGQLLFRTDKKCLYKFIFNLGIKGAIAFNRFQRRLKKGDFFPAFHFISVTDECNLRCQGCWVTGKAENKSLDPALLDQIITEVKANGSFFFGILGGEPLMYPTLLDVFTRHSDCYFQLFTNGTLLSAEIAEKLRRCGNVSPLISFEGTGQVADIRRGGKNIHARTTAAIDNAVDAGLVTGVAISVCKSNIDLALSADFIDSLVKKGVIYLWYYIYRPAGENPMTELALEKAEIQQLREFIVDARVKFNIAIIDTYWDENGMGLCPAASGLSHHINAGGYIEPCPVIQFSTDRINGTALSEIYASSEFLSGFRHEIPLLTSGCVVMENPEWLADFAERHGATDTSGRGNELQKLRGMPVVPGHASGVPVAEKSWWYRFAKKRAFFGLGAYG